MKLKRLLCLLAALVLVLGLALPAAAAEKQVTILFTHDMHSHLLPANDESGSSYGGYARLMTAIRQEKATAPNALLVDGGDFSMGSLFQTAYATDALELRIMGAMGYDVATFGNHEFDYRPAGLAGMLNAAVASGEPLPALVEANYRPPKLGESGYGADAEAVWSAWQNYGVQDYTVVQRDGVNFAVFGITGQDSHECAPLSGFVLQDPAQTAQAIVEQIEAEVPQPRVVVCLSHSGTSTDAKKSEDEQLAKAVDGIDVIVSAHSHTTLHQPLKIDDTYIVSCGEYSKNLGVLQLSFTAEGLRLDDYRLVAINDSMEEDPAIAARVEQYKGLVEESYLSRFGLGFDQVLAHNPVAFESQNEMYENHHESPLGNLIADSYRWAVQQAEGESYIPVDFALTAAGVVRESLPQGDVTVSDVFNVSSLGSGADGLAGYPLVSVYITGKDLKNAFEVDASVQPLMSAAQLYFAGMEFEYNPHRMIFNKVTSCAQVLEDGTRLPIKDDRLYRVVTGLYCGQMLGAVNGKSFGILSITPRDAQGNPVENLDDYILHDSDGSEVKEWYALAGYLQQMGSVESRYAAPEGRKVANPSWSPAALLAGANWLTIAVVVVLVVLAAAVVLVVLLVRKKVRSKSEK